jgi:hypothetical protein
MLCNQVDKTDLAAVLRFVADDPPGVHDAPEGMGISADAVKDLEWHPLLVPNILGFNAFDEKLLHVPVADIDGQGPPHVKKFMERYGVSRGREIPAGQGAHERPWPQQIIPCQSFPL